MYYFDTKTAVYQIYFSFIKLIFLENIWDAENFFKYKNNVFIFCNILIYISIRLI